MASGKDKKDSPEGSINEQVVTAGTRRDKGRNINDEIAFQRLAHNIKEGKLNPDRVHKYLDQRANENGDLEKEDDRK